MPSSLKITSIKCPVSPKFASTEAKDDQVSVLMHKNLHSFYKSFLIESSLKKVLIIEK